MATVILSKKMSGSMSGTAYFEIPEEIKTDEDTIDWLCRLRSDVTYFVPRFKDEYIEALTNAIEAVRYKISMEVQNGKNN